MKKNYICPECRGTLNVNGSIVFVGEKKDNTRGVVLLSTKVGDYGVKTSPTYTIDEGQRLDFFCPLCNADLKATEIDKNLARVLRVNPDIGTEEEVIFSEISGQHSTYILNNDEVESFGEDNNAYMNFFGEGPKY